MDQAGDGPSTTFSIATTKRGGAKACQIFLYQDKDWKDLGILARYCLTQEVRD